MISGKSSDRNRGRAPPRAPDSRERRRFFPPAADVRTLLLRGPAAGVRVPRGGLRRRLAPERTPGAEPPVVDLRRVDVVRQTREALPRAAAAAAAAGPVALGAGRLGRLGQGAHLLPDAAARRLPRRLLRRLRRLPRRLLRRALLRALGDDPAKLRRLRRLGAVVVPAATESDVEPSEVSEVDASSSDASASSDDSPSPSAYAATFRRSSSSLSTSDASSFSGGRVVGASSGSGAGSGFSAAAAAVRRRRFWRGRPRRGGFPRRLGQTRGGAFLKRSHHRRRVRSSVCGVRVVVVRRRRPIEVPSPPLSPQPPRVPSPPPRLPSPGPVLVPPGRILRGCGGFFVVSFVSAFPSPRRAPRATSARWATAPPPPPAEKAAAVSPRPGARRWPSL